MEGIEFVLMTWFTLLLLVVLFFIVLPVFRVYEVCDILPD